MLEVVRKTKFRNAYASTWKKGQTYDNLKVSLAGGVETNPIRLSPEFFALPWAKSGGLGCLFVLPLGEFGRVAPNPPLIEAHPCSITDFCFHPFQPDLLLSAAADASLKLWKIPMGEGLAVGGRKEDLEAGEELDWGVTKPMNVPKVDLSVVSSAAHNKKKISLVAFHPWAENVLLTGGADGRLLLWDLSKQSPTVHIDLDGLGHKNLVQSVSWSFDGSIMATSSKDKQLRMVDPRGKLVVAIVEAHHSIKGFRTAWLGHTPYISSTGFTKENHRDLAIWDSRNMSQTLSRHVIDSGHGFMMPFYDMDTGIMFLGGKGDSNIRYYDITPEETTCCHLLDNYQPTGATQIGLAMFPKTMCEPTNCEFARFLKLRRDKLETVSFMVPRQGKGSQFFQEDIFPETLSGEAALTAEQWFQGQKAKPKFKQLKKEGQVSIYDVSKAEGGKRRPGEESESPSEDSDEDVFYHEGNSDRKEGSEEKEDAESEEEKQHDERINKHEQTLSSSEPPAITSSEGHSNTRPRTSWFSRNSSSSTSPLAGCSRNTPSVGGFLSRQRPSINDTSSASQTWPKQEVTKTNEGIQASKKNTKKAKKTKKEVALEGFLWKQKPSKLRKAWDRRWFAVRGDVLYYFQNSTTSSSLGSIPLQSILSVEATKDNCIWNLVTPKRVYTLQASSEQECKRWSEGLAERIKRINDNDAVQESEIGHALREAATFTTNIRPVSIKVAVRQQQIPTPICGYLLKKSPNSVGGWQKRWFCMQEEGVLFYMESQESTGQPLGNIHMDKVLSIRDASTKFGGHRRHCCFQIDTGERVYFLQAPSRDERDRWIRELNLRLQQHKTPTSLPSSTTNSMKPSPLPSLGPSQRNLVFQSPSAGANKNNALASLQAEEDEETLRQLMAKGLITADALDVYEEEEEPHLVNHQERTEMEGYLMKSRGMGYLFSGWKRRWCKCADGMLVYFASEVAAKPKGTIYLESSTDIRPLAHNSKTSSSGGHFYGMLSSRKDKEMQNAFELTVPALERTFFFLAKDTVERNEWLTFLRAEKRRMAARRALEAESWAQSESEEEEEEENEEELDVEQQVQELEEVLSGIDKDLHGMDGAVEASAVMQQTASTNQDDEGGTWETKFRMLEDRDADRQSLSVKAAQFLKQRLEELKRIQETEEVNQQKEWLQDEQQEGGRRSDNAGDKQSPKRPLMKLNWMQRLNVQELSFMEVAGLRPIQFIDLVLLRKGKSKMLIQCFGRAKDLRCRQVDVKHPILNQGHVYLLDCGTVVYQWNGCMANRLEKAKGLDIASQIRFKERGGTPKFVIIDDTKEDENAPDFWRALGVQPSEAIYNPTTNKAHPSVSTYDAVKRKMVQNVDFLINLYRVRDSKVEERKIRLVHKNSRPSKKKLDCRFCYVLDCFSELFVWIGTQSKLASRQLVMKVARALLRQPMRKHTRSILCSTSKDAATALSVEFKASQQEKDIEWAERPAWTAITKIMEHAETTLFWEKFCDHVGMLPIQTTQQTKGSGSFIARRKEQPMIDIHYLREKNKDLRENCVYHEQMECRYKNGLLRTEEMEEWKAKQLADALERERKEKGEGKVLKQVEGDECIGEAEKYEDIQEHEGSEFERKMKEKNKERLAQLLKVKEQDSLSKQIIVWKIDEFTKRPQEERLYGQFWSAENYILMDCFVDVWKGKERRIVYFWQGRESDVREKGTSALLTVELMAEIVAAQKEQQRARVGTSSLPDLLETAFVDVEDAIQLRVVQYKEPARFCSLFPFPPVLHQGDLLDSTDNPEARQHKFQSSKRLLTSMKNEFGTTNAEKRMNINSLFFSTFVGDCKLSMFQLRKSNTTQRRMIVEVPARISSLDSRYVFILLKLHNNCRTLPENLHILNAKYLKKKKKLPKDILLSATTGGNRKEDHLPSPQQAQVEKMGTGYIWVGKGVNNKYYEELCQKAAQHIIIGNARPDIDTSSMQPALAVINEGTEPEEFWQWLELKEKLIKHKSDKKILDEEKEEEKKKLNGTENAFDKGSGKIRKNREEKLEKKQQRRNYFQGRSWIECTVSPRLFQCSGATGIVEVEEVLDFSQDDLVSSSVMILDTHLCVFVWIGTHSREIEKKIALDTAVQFVENVEDGCSTNAQVYIVREYHEPLAFTHHFPGWSQLTYPSSKRNLVVLEPVPAVEVLQDYSRKTFLYEELLSDPLPPSVDPSHLERYLNDDEFVSIFKRDREDFYRLPEWKQVALKQRVYLF
ncbi:Coronin-like protein crn1 [Balamuthia mandrillaris]